MSFAKRTGDRLRIADYLAVDAVRSDTASKYCHVSHKVLKFAEIDSMLPSFYDGWLKSQRSVPFYVIVYRLRNP